MAIKLKNVENETQTMYELEYGKKYWKREKWEMHTVGPVKSREKWKQRKWEKHTLGSVYGEITEKHGK